MKVLIILDVPPAPGIIGNPERNFHLIRSLSQQHQVAVFCLSHRPGDLHGMREVERYCSTVETVTIIRSKLRFAYRCLWAMLHGEPVQNGFFASREAYYQIQRLCREQQFDIIHIEHAFMAPYLRAAGKGNFKSVLFLHNIGPILWKRIYCVETRVIRKVEYGLDFLFAKLWEHRICRKFDQCVVYSEVDRDLYLSSTKKNNVSVVSCGIDVGQIPYLPRPKHMGELLYIGKMTYPPNRDAVRYFCYSILPLILERRRDICFHALGQPALEELKASAPPEALDLAGRVNDPADYYRRCAVSVVPLRAGSGVRLKILESMAYGRPVVTTSIGCEGLHVTHMKNIWVADTPQDFAEGVLRLLFDEALWKQMAENGRRFVEENHECYAMSQKILKVYESLTATGKL